MTDFKVRFQQYVYQLCKEYAYGSQEVIGEFATNDELHLEYSLCGGSAEMIDYNGPYTLYKNESWVTIGEDQ
jgi:hypothetical protein